MGAVHDFIGINLFVFAVMISICLFIDVALKKHRVLWLPESVAMIFVGFIVGALALLFSNVDEEHALTFNPEIFFFVLLPPIVFEAGYSLKQKNFFKNIGAILLYAVFGTIVSAIIIGFVLYGMARRNWIPLVSDNPMECLLFGSLISATDPVATYYLTFYLFISI